MTAAAERSRLTEPTSHDERCRTRHGKTQGSKHDMHDDVAKSPSGSEAEARITAAQKCAGHYNVTTKSGSRCSGHSYAKRKNEGGKQPNDQAEEDRGVLMHSRRWRTHIKFRSPVAR
jgi:hypothetical protein